MGLLGVNPKQTPQYTSTSAETREFVRFGNPSYTRALKFTTETRRTLRFTEIHCLLSETSVSSVDVRKNLGQTPYFPRSPRQLAFFLGNRVAVPIFPHVP